ncbi:hypothetical protein J4G07_13055 [Candidatus Poribacteria bacterium]|nr:hypothetical protein [Candidatus Poribacteria bacterium]
MKNSVDTPIRICYTSDKCAFKHIIPLISDRWEANRHQHPSDHEVI